MLRRILFNERGFIGQEIKIIYIPAVEFEITTGNSGEINSTGIHGHSMDGAGGELSTLSYKPFEFYNFNIAKSVYVQVVWCPIDGTTTNGVTWVITYDQDSFESGILTAPATALDTVIAEDPEHATSYVIQKTAQGIINAGSLNVTDPIAWRVEADVVDSSNDPGCWFMGLLLTQEAE